jgi:predicted AlkP superfamily phosphohydrolase/phosphomutase
LGIDGATFNLLKPWLAKDELPTLKKLIQEGIHGYLKSTIPCLSIPAIPSLCTGMNPGKFGIFGFRKSDGSIVTSTDFEEDFIWDILADIGVRSCIVNLTGTYPPLIKNGIMISGGVPSEESEYTCPKELKSEIRGFHLNTNLIKELFHKKTESEIVDLASLTERKRWKIFKNIMENDDFDLGIFWILLSDDIQHFYWGFDAVLLKFYQEIDKILKELIETFSDYNFLIVSDHGFESMPKYWFHINSWLKERNYLKVKEGNVRNWFFGNISSFIQYMWRALPDNIKYFAFKFIPMDKKNIKDVKNFLIGVDWKNTIAYVDASTWGIRLSIEDPKKYERFRSKIIEELKNLKNSEGETILKGAWKKEEIYSGKYLEEIPDIIYLTDEKFQTNPFLTRKKIIMEIKSRKDKELRGEHFNARDGIFIAYGSIFKKGYEIEDLDIFDVAPTILHAMGCSIPKDMDGKVIKEIFKKDSELEKQEIEFQKRERKKITKYKVKKEEMDQMKERLQALGYLD